MTDSEVSLSGETLGKGCLGIHGPDLKEESGCLCWFELLGFILWFSLRYVMHMSETFSMFKPSYFHVSIQTGFTFLALSLMLSSTLFVLSPYIFSAPEHTLPLMGLVEVVVPLLTGVIF